jgi:hypothetical protein
MNQILGCAGLFGWGNRFGIEHVKANVPFNYFRHQRVHASPADGNVVQNLGAFRFLVEAAFDCVDLSPDPPDTIQ